MSASYRRKEKEMLQEATISWLLHDTRFAKTKVLVRYSSETGIQNDGWLYHGIQVSNHLPDFTSTSRASIRRVDTEHERCKQGARIEETKATGTAKPT